MDTGDVMHVDDAAAAAPANERDSNGGVRDRHGDADESDNAEGSIQVTVMMMLYLRNTFSMHNTSRVSDRCVRGIITTPTRARRRVTLV